MEFLKRTWATVDLAALQHNFRAVRQLVSAHCMPIPVIKADAYGHGSVRCAQALVQAGATYFAVSNLDEALVLRENGIDTPILILGYTPPSKAETLATSGIVQTLLDEEYATHLSEAACQADVTVHTHLKVDTGMSRIGFWYQDTDDQAAAIKRMVRACRLPNLAVDGIFTHFTSADEPDLVPTERQFALFTDVIERLQANGITFPLKHCCNSAATIAAPDKHMDAVRPGLMLYGLYPDASLADKVELHPVMQVKSIISMIKTVPVNTTVSYGRTYTTDRETRLATVPIGYGDGYPRSAGNQGYMLVAGRKAPIVGRVCMDQCVLDVTDIPDACEGMTVTVFGRDGDAVLSAEQVADWKATISYELVCQITDRVPRVYES